MSDPVQLSSDAAHKAPNYGTGFAPYFIPLSLWVGAMVAYMLIQPLNRRALAMGAASWRVALSGWLPVFGVGVLQTAALMSVLHFALGLEMVRAAGDSRLPRPGHGVLLGNRSVAERAVRTGRADPGAGAADAPADLCGRHLPCADQPRLLRRHPPVSADELHRGGAAAKLITGGDLAPVWQGGVVLLAFTAGALALTSLTARGRQVVRMKDLHPELSL